MRCLCHVMGHLTTGHETSTAGSLSLDSDSSDAALCYRETTFFWREEILPENIGLC